MIKKHLSGGTLHDVMVKEVLRCLNKYQDAQQPLVNAALELGVTPKTLRQWKGPVEKGGWKELQGYGGVEFLMGAIKGATPSKKPRKLKYSKKPNPIV